MLVNRAGGTGVVSHGPAGQVKCPIAVRGSGDKCVVPDC